MAARLGLSTAVPPPQEEDIIFGVLRAHTSSAVAIPLTQAMLKIVQACWGKPASIPVSNKKLDHLYRTQESNAGFLFKHPQPNSLIISSSSRSRRHHSTPPDKEGKKLDAYGRRLYSTGALGIKSNNYAACLSCYIHAIFEDLEPILQTVSTDLKPKALQLCADGLAAARQTIATARHGLETSAKTLTTGVAIRRHSWLRVTSLLPDSKAAIEDLPFDGEGLFHASTDSTLQEIDKNLKASRTLGFSHQQQQYRPRQTYTKPWQRRSFPSKSPDRSWRQ